MKRETVHTLLIILVILVVGYGASITLSPQPTSSAQQKSPWSTCHPTEGPSCSTEETCSDISAIPGQKPIFRCVPDGGSLPPSLGSGDPWDAGSGVSGGGGSEGVGSSAWTVGDAQEQINRVNSALDELRLAEDAIRAAGLRWQ